MIENNSDQTLPPTLRKSYNTIAVDYDRYQILLMYEQLYFKLTNLLDIYAAEGSTAKEDLERFYLIRKTFIEFEEKILTYPQVYSWLRSR